MALPPDILSKKGGRWRSVRLSDVVTLLYHVQAGAAHPEVGFEDAQHSISMLMQKLGKRVLLDPAAIESALWSCNLLNERGEFKDYQGRDFDRFVKDLLGPEDLNRTYHWLTSKRD